MQSRSVQDYLYKEAFIFSSNSTGFVLITLFDAKTKQSKKVCITADALVRALLAEEGKLNTYTKESYERAQQLALKSKSRVFHFSKEKSLELVRPKYGMLALNDVREGLKEHSKEELLRKFGSALSLVDEKSLPFLKKPGKEIRKMIDSRDEHGLEAVYAHALIERGLFARDVCSLGPFFWVNPGEQYPKPKWLN